MHITSPDNPNVKYLRRLQRNATFRQREKKFLIESPAAVKTILENRQRPEMLYWCRDFLKEATGIIETAQKRKIPITELSAACFKKITDVRAPQGIAALFSFFHFDIEEIFHYRSAFILCCCGIQDPGNLGTLIRTADAADATAVITLPPSTSFYNPKVVRASAGSILNIPLIAIDEDEFLTNIKKNRIKIFAATPRGGTSLRKTRFELPMCIMVGSEAYGLPLAIMKISRRVSIPMRAGVESLNAAVAGALLLYQASYRAK